MRRWSIAVVQLVFMLKMCKLIASFPYTCTCRQDSTAGSMASTPVITPLSSPEKDPEGGKQQERSNNKKRFKAQYDALMNSSESWEPPNRGKGEVQGMVVFGAEGPLIVVLHERSKDFFCCLCTFNDHIKGPIEQWSTTFSLFSKSPVAKEQVFSIPYTIYSTVLLAFLFG